MEIKPLFSALLAAAALALALATPAQATLAARDIDGNNVTDAFYDTDLNITWLRNADVNGLMNWGTANTWANGYSFGGYNDWRLPTALQDGSTCVYNCIGSEMGHLWFTELGNLANGPMTNDGDFLNMRHDQYWLGTEDARNPNRAWLFNTNAGYQNILNKSGQLYALAVRDGDVRDAQVPEPGTGLLAVAALAGLGLIRRRRAVGPSAL